MKENQIEKSSGNLYADLNFKNPEEMQVKADLAYEIYMIMKCKKLTQAKVAKLLNLTQPKVSNLVNGRLAGFSIERLMRFLNILDYDVEINLKPKSKGRAHINVSGACVGQIPMAAQGK